MMTWQDYGKMRDKGPSPGTGSSSGSESRRGSGMTRYTTIDAECVRRHMSDLVTQVTMKYVMTRLLRQRGPFCLYI